MSIRLAGVVMPVFAAVAVTTALAPVWTLGRAVIEVQSGPAGQQKMWHLKLSLRNEGKPGYALVRILGRWEVREGRGKPGEQEQPSDQGRWDRLEQPGQPGRWGSPGETPKPGRPGLPWGTQSPPEKPEKEDQAPDLKGFTQLGSYTREVALKQTAILDVPLQPLGPVPSGRPALELVILTGSQETDRQVIRSP